MNLPWVTLWFLKHFRDIAVIAYEDSPLDRLFIMYDKSAYRNDDSTNICNI